MTGNEEKKWPLGRGPAFHSSQLSLCASELQKCAHDGTSGHLQQTWSTTFLGWHRSGGPGMIPHCTNSKNLQVFLGIIICTLLSLKYEGCGRKILEGHGVFQPIKRGFNGYRSRVWWILGSWNTGKGHSRAVCQANLQRLGIHIINAHFPSLQTDLDFFSPCPALFWASQTGEKTEEKVEMGSNQRKLDGCKRRKQKADKSRRKLLDGACPEVDVTETEESQKPIGISQGNGGGGGCPGALLSEDASVPGMVRKSPGRNGRSIGRPHWHSNIGVVRDEGFPPKSLGV